MQRDRYGYPIDDVLAERFHGPIPLPGNVDDATRRDHYAACNAYQERFRVAFMERVRSRS